MGLAHLLIALLPAVSSPSLSDDDLLRHAESAFAEGTRLRDDPAKARPHFRTAAELYAELRARGAGNAALHRNEGNAWLLADELPRAILAYRRGLRLDPTDAALRESLTFAREQVIYPAQDAFARPPVDAWPPWLPRLGLSPWSFGAVLALYAFGWAALTRWRMTRAARFLSLGLAGLGLAAAVFFLLLFAEGIERRQDEHPPVVIARDGVVLRVGNGEAYPSRYHTPLNRGVEARVLFERGGWLQIRLSGGEVGWVPAEAALLE